ncbi:hypothetical protein HK405_007711 [Cladochytrium tenue]|nr:hypothetical protein HK405_007711 [Cladochytrium tenue]
MSVHTIVDASQMTMRTTNKDIGEDPGRCAPQLGFARRHVARWLDPNTPASTCSAGHGRTSSWASNQTSSKQPRAFASRHSATPGPATRPPCCAACLRRSQPRISLGLAAHERAGGSAPSNRRPLDLLITQHGARPLPRWTAAGAG